MKSGRCPWIHLLGTFASDDIKRATFLSFRFPGKVADVVLSCSLVEEAAGLRGMNTGSSFSQAPATLVFRDVAVASDESLDLLPPFVPPSVPDPDALIIEAKGLCFSWVQGAGVF